jgi:hypothetical protein
MSVDRLHLSLAPAVLQPLKYRQHQLSLQKQSPDFVWQR